MVINRAFFPEVDVGKRFFFFNSLDKPNKYNKKLIPYGLLETAAAVKDELNRYPLNEENKMPDEILQPALQFLQNAYQRELAAEKNFYRKNIIDNKDLPEDYRKKIAACIGDDDFDYYNFMNILKEYEESTLKWKHQLSETHEQLDIFNKEINKIRTSTDTHDSYEEEISPLIKRIYKEEDYAHKQNRASHHKAEARGNVIANAQKGITRQNSDDIFNLVNKSKELLLSILENNSKISIPNTNPKLKDTFINEIIVEICEDIYSKRDNKNDSIKIVIDELTELIKVLESIKEQKTDQKDKKFEKMLLDKIEYLEKASEVLEQETKELFPSKEYIKEGKSDLVGFSKNIRDRLAKFFEGDDEKGYLHRMAKKNLTPKERAKYIREIKKRALQYMGKNSNDEIVDETRREIKDTLNAIISSQSKLTLSGRAEFRSAQGLKNFLGKGVARVIGQKNQKADVISFPLGLIFAEYEIPEKDQQEIGQIVMDAYTQTLNDERKTALKIIRDQTEYYIPTMANPGSKKRGERDDRGTLFKTSSAYSTEADQIAHDAAIKSARDALDKKLEEYEKYPLKGPIALKDLFFLENSVKRSEYYMNDYGFKGGSLGAHLGEQLVNITRMAELGGITKPDIDWLTFAVLNSGKGMLGNYLKTPLEIYFTSFASALMFQSTSDIWKQTEDHLKENKLLNQGRENSIRLYTFDRLFVPASYLLLTTYNALKNASTLLENTINIQNFAIINNNVSEKNKVNTVKNDKTGEAHYTQATQAWYETAATNYPKVTIEMRLLAGFLDVLNKLEDLMKQSGV